jgi:hypothetical protein
MPKKPALRVDEIATIEPIEFNAIHRRRGPA